MRTGFVASKVCAAIREEFDRKGSVEGKASLPRLQDVLIELHLVLDGPAQKILERQAKKFVKLNQSFSRNFFVFILLKYFTINFFRATQQG